MQPKTVIFIGPQGSGKGTQVAKVKEYLNDADDRPVIELETGSGFRALAKRDTYTSRRVAALLEQGSLVPNFLTSSIVMAELSERMVEDAHLVIDGFPRNLDQARVLEQVMEFYERGTLTVVHLDVPENIVRERMKGRGRADDTDEVIDTRLAHYRHETEPLVSYYKERADTNFIYVDASVSIEEVYTAIKSKL